MLARMSGCECGWWRHPTLGSAEVTLASVLWPCLRTRASWAHELDHPDFLIQYMAQVRSEGREAAKRFRAPPMAASDIDAGAG
jgi:hypothetical protein